MQSLRAISFQSSVYFLSFRNTIFILLQKLEKFTKYLSIGHVIAYPQSLELTFLRTTTQILVRSTASVLAFCEESIFLLQISKEGESAKTKTTVNKPELQACSIINALNQPHTGTWPARNALDHLRLLFLNSTLINGRIP